MTIRQISCILKFGFLLKYFNKKQIGDWASKKVMENCNDINIIELTFIENKSNNETLTLLNLLIGEMSMNDIQFINQYYLGFFKEELVGKKTKSNWIAIENEILKYFSLDDDLASGNDISWLISILSNDYSLRKDGLTGVMKMPQDLILLLDKFENFKGMQEQLDKENISNPQLMVR